MAGRIQLETTGKQDQFFTLDSEFTYFRETFRRHSAHAVEHVGIDPDIEGADFGKTVSFTIPQNLGDLLKGVSLRVTLPPINVTNVGYIESIGHALIERADFFIGDELVHRITGDWLQLHSEHFHTQTKQQALYQLVGKYPYRVAGVRSNNPAIIGVLGEATVSRDWHVHLPFWFSDTPSLALPLTAITKQECRVEIKLRDYKDLVVNVVNGTKPTLSSALKIEAMDLQADVVFVDKWERIKIRKATPDYMITQNQQNNFKIPKGENTAKFKLSFMNPVKELYFVIQSEGAWPFDYDNYRQIYDNKHVLYEHLDYLTLDLDREEVIPAHVGKAIFLKAAQAAIHHSKTQLIRRFYSYSFALQPESHESTGSVNFSMIKDQILTLNVVQNLLNDRNVRVYARSFNVLRIRDGQAKVLFGCTI